MLGREHPLLEWEWIWLVEDCWAVVLCPVISSLSISFFFILRIDFCLLACCILRIDIHLLCMLYRTIFCQLHLLCIRFLCPDHILVCSTKVHLDLDELEKYEERNSFYFLHPNCDKLTSNAILTTAASGRNWRAAMKLSAHESEHICMWVYHNLDVTKLISLLISPECIFMPPLVM